MSIFGAVLAELSPRVSRTRARLSTIAICALVTGALGSSTAIAVVASPACGQFVRTYVDRLQRNVATSATLRRWREWGVKHPNWHLAANALKRPKYKKVREEKVSRMQIACPILTPEIPTLTASLEDFFLPLAAPTFAEALDTPTTVPLQTYRTPAGYSSPGPIFSGGSAAGGGGSAPSGGGPIASSPVSPTPIADPTPVTPIAPIATTPISTTPISNPVPITPVSPAPVPEPDSIVLTLTGAAALAAFACFRRKQPTSRVSI